MLRPGADSQADVAFYLAGTFSSDGGRAAFTNLLGNILLIRNQYTTYFQIR